MDFEVLKPKAAVSLENDAPQESVLLFDFEIVEVDEPRFQASPKATTLLNDRMAIAIALFLLLVPIPYGSNRPLAWLAAAGAVGLMAFVYFFMSSFSASRRRMQLRNYWKVLVPGLLAIGFALFQMLPITFGSVGDLPAVLLPDRLTLSSSAGAWGILRMLSYALLFILVSEVCTNRHRTSLMLKWVFYGIVIHAIWALVSLGALSDTLLFQVKYDYAGYATGTFINRNSFATFMGMGMVIGASLVASDMCATAHRSTRSRSKHKGLTTENMFFLVMVFVVFGALVLSASRLGIFSSLLGTWFSVSAILLRKGVRKSKVIGGTFIIGILGIVAMLGLAGESVLERFVFILVNTDDRLELYRQTMDMIASRPFFGFGLDTYSMAFEIFHQPELPTSIVWDKPHNTYLTLWSELGILAGSLPPLAVFAAFIFMIAALRNSARNHLPSAAAGGVIILGAVHSLGDFSLEIAANTYVFVAIVALGMARRRHEIQEYGE